MSAPAQVTTGGNAVPACWWNRRATAASYAAMAPYASAARRSRNRLPVAQSLSASSFSTAAYCDTSVTTVTCAWFLAAARTIAGPPMSTFSTHSAHGAPRATVLPNG